ncbi:MAG: 2-C-methyl-D-erythritol 2,4-cyclodiphosphate synthase [Candidatus Symbiothrix sp.]|jgi:2-C-methyl-D-erythritol 2,4-cyclodiphosphate synthase|nr:2-C-methyl-D-erythritol 2,4-cyclodiphosphate synthase [Candidatus Symbiothrix sp.]
MNIRVGFGYDVHPFAENRALWLGGIQIEYTQGLKGHSDADVLIHAVCDALLGAANLRDIGFHFPDTAGKYKNIDSKILLAHTMELLRAKNYEVGNVDVTVCAEKPKLNPYIPQMKTCLSQVMQTDEDAISIKATTSEKMGFVGREEGIAVFATALINRL